MKGVASHQKSKGIKVCRICGLEDVDQNTCMSCRKKLVKQKRGKLKNETA